MQKDSDGMLNRSPRTPAVLGSLSTYARQFLGLMHKPDVDAIGSGIAS